MHQKNQNKQHVPVLLGEVLQYLNPQPGETYLDLTVGYGGHAQAILERTLNGQLSSRAVLVDRDQQAIAAISDQFSHQGVQIIHNDFLSAARELKEAGQQFSMILADLGVSSPHLDRASRGFTFREDGPLDMRMDQTQELTAATIVNSYSQAQLAELFQRYGEEPRANKIARLIVEHRPWGGTAQLAETIAQALGRHSKIHPATRTFQALRIAVNNELEILHRAVPIWIDDLLAPGGRIAVISFHSLEDRIVKQEFAERSQDSYDATLYLLTKSPVTAQADELVFNPRARSAKLRAAAKINKGKGSA